MPTIAKTYRRTLLSPLGLDLDGSLQIQTQLKNHLAELRSLRHLENDIRLYANKRGLNALRTALAGTPMNHPCLTFIGSGDFHHVTLALLERIAAQHDSFTLLLIDNHPDWFVENPLFDCGNWVSGFIRTQRQIRRRAAGLSSKTRLIMVGQDSHDFRPHRWRVSPFQELCRGAIQFYPLQRQIYDAYGCWPAKTESSGRCHWWGTRLSFKSIRGDGGSSWITDIAQSLAGQNVYISIDKDVLRPGDACTDWEQGGLYLSELIELIMAVAQASTIIGADVCGEHAATPLQGVWKRLDAGRYFSHPHADIAGLAANERANLAILQALT